MEIFNDEDLEEGVEFREASEEKIEFCRNGFGEPKGAFAFSERKEVCQDRTALVLGEVAEVAEQLETVNGQVKSTVWLKVIK